MYHNIQRMLSRSCIVHCNRTSLAVMPGSSHDVIRGAHTRPSQAWLHAFAVPLFCEAARPILPQEPSGRLSSTSDRRAFLLRPLWMRRATFTARSRQAFQTESLFSLSFNYYSSIFPTPSSRQPHARNLLVNLIHHPPLLPQHIPRPHLTDGHLLDPHIPRPLHVPTPLDQQPRVEPGAPLAPAVFPALGAAAGVDCVDERGVEGQGAGFGDEEGGGCEGCAEGEGEGVEVRG